MKQQIAIYLRLSLEDVDKRTNKVKDAGWRGAATEPDRNELGQS